MARGKDLEGGTSLLKVGVKRLRKDKLAMFGLIVLGVFAMVAIFAPIIVSMVLPYKICYIPISLHRRSTG